MRHVHRPDDPALADLLQAQVERAGGSSVTGAGGGSDHVPFEQAGVTVGGVNSGATEILTPEQASASGSKAGLPADACYHQACDDRSNTRLELAGILTTAIGETIRRRRRWRRDPGRQVMRRRWRRHAL